jgi:glucose/arabinose dehydrogenase
MRTGRAIALAILMSCVGVAELDAQLRLRTLATGFTLPIAAVQDPTDRNVQLIVQQDGHVRALRGASVLSADFLDVSSSILAGGEQGLLGLAFPPDAPTSGRFFVNFTNRSGNAVVARFRRSSSPLTADVASRFDLRWGGAAGPAFIAHPYANHNGGNLAFGSDGYLYVGLGDGGSGNDPEHRAQNPREYLGKMLRIDVNVADGHASGYEVPGDNPFLHGGPPSTLPEIWAFGLRNPFRYSFDDPARGGTGALVIGDVGQDKWEEVDYEPRGRGGRNYGWRNREGAHDNVTSLPVAFQPLTDPIHEYDHSVGQCIIGGYVYRGTALPAGFRGRYFFADYVQGKVFSLALTIDANGEARASGVLEHTAELGGFSQLGNISSFGVDADGELLLVSYSLGRVLKVIGPPAAPSAPTGFRIVR